MPSSEVLDLLKRQELNTFYQMAHSFSENIGARLSAISLYERFIGKLLVLKLPPGCLPELQASVEAFHPLPMDLKEKVLFIVFPELWDTPDTTGDDCIQRRWYPYDDAAWDALVAELNTILLPWLANTADPILQYQIDLVETELARAAEGIADNSPVVRIRQHLDTVKKLYTEVRSELKAWS